MQDERLLKGEMQVKTGSITKTNKNKNEVSRSSVTSTTTLHIKLFKQAHNPKPFHRIS